MRNKFDPLKAVEVLLYISSKVGGDMYTTLKILYLADKKHLEKYGSLILGDWYAALQYGPVASNSYDILKFVRGESNYDAGAPGAKDAFQLDKNDQIIPLREADTNFISESDTSCIDEIITEHGDKNFDELHAEVQDAAYKAAPKNGGMDIHAIVSTLPNGAEVNQYLSDPYPD